jgi:hypothetical protein
MCLCDDVCFAGAPGTYDCSGERQIKLSIKFITKKIELKMQGMLLSVSSRTIQVAAVEVD